MCRTHKYLHSALFNDKYNKITVAIIYAHIVKLNYDLRFVQLTQIFKKKVLSKNYFPLKIILQY